MEANHGTAFPGASFSPDVPFDRAYYVKSESRYTTSRLLFTQDMQTQQPVVMKALSSYKDARYDLETISKRQHCQLLALHLNRSFTPNIYIGLGHAKEYSSTRILLDQLLEDPTEDQLDSRADYFLLMYELPQDKRLDRLLAHTGQPGKYLQLVIRRVVQMHEHLKNPPLCDESGIIWGGCEQLQKKLLHNLDLFEQLLRDSITTDYNCDDWVAQILSQIKGISSSVFCNSTYQRYFEQRLQDKRIKHCHGDLKARHIWITSEITRCSDADIKIIDSIDFNPAYCYIDTLSDFAMLAIDIQAHTKSESLVNDMIEWYLRESRQDNEACRAVLDYYLLEKAMVGATLSIFYEGELARGIQFLSMAESLCATLQDRFGDR